jgi:hypothetical protein
MQTFNNKPKKKDVNYVVGYNYNQDVDMLHEYEYPEQMINTFYHGKYITQSRDDLVTHLDNIFNWHISNYEYRLKQQNDNEEMLLIEKDLNRLIEKREKIFKIILGVTA